LNTANESSVWGTLTGIRPAKKIEKAIESGMSKTEATNMLIKDYQVSPKRAKLSADIAEKTLSLKGSLDPHAISLYISIPFCPTRCAYCSFISNSVEKALKLIEPYIELLQNEITQTAQLVNELGLKVISVYIGGGTPTVLSANQLEIIMQQLNTAFDLSNLPEYTVEAGRPDTITIEKLNIMKQQGANRVCINPQSMSEDVLKAIGRKHTPEDIIASVKPAGDLGLILNMDIIAGLPGDTPKGFKNTLDTVIALNPENITIHTLSLKKGTKIMLEDTPRPIAKDVEEMLDYASDTLTNHNYIPYYLYRQKYTSGNFENTGWSKAGFEGLYNKLMMDEIGTVFAMGAGAVTKLVLPDDRIERIFNMKYPREYILNSDRISGKIETIIKYYTPLRSEALIHSLTGCKMEDNLCHTHII